MAELYLVRHAQASFGTGDYDLLSALGHRQARWLGEYFRYRGLSFDRVICGGMVRHRETAEGVLHGMDRDPGGMEVDPAWSEFDFEAIVGAYLQQFPEQEPVGDQPVRRFSRILRNALLAWSEARLEQSLPEQWPEFESRIDRALSSLRQSGPEGGRTLLISSGGPIAMTLRRVLDAPPGAMVHMNLQLINSSFSRLYFNTGRMHLAGFNHAPHFDHPERAESLTYY